MQGNTFSDKMNKAKAPSTLNPNILENTSVLSALGSRLHGDGVLATENEAFRKHWTGEDGASPSR